MAGNDLLYYADAELHFAENNRQHHTDEVTVDKLVVRRGQTFKLTVTLKEAFNSYDPLLFMILTGNNSTEETGTRCYASYPNGIQRSPKAIKVWKVDLDKRSALHRGVLVLNFTPPADASVGKYYIVSKYKTEVVLLGELMLLFNPWNPEDSVFMPGEADRYEYVMNEQGVIFVGNARYSSPRPWDYGQFEENMVDIVMMILDRSLDYKRNPLQDTANRSDPAYVGRVLSAMINSNDDNGVIVGRWSDPYSDGKRPTYWDGSHPILTQWFKNNGHPVKFGQCWVFAGVLCTVLRFLGIPCRVITNFASAHDHNSSLTIDEYFNEDGSPAGNSQDSVWNFHVWVEGHMRRPDLSRTGSYDGWQVLDATPQERSDGIFCCGPSPKKAILEGDTNIIHDTPFVFAEVNSDRVWWLIRRNGSRKRLEEDTDSIGKNISTKKVGSNGREDVTDTYKYKEGTKKEREVYRRAISRLYETASRSREEERRERFGRGGVEMLMSSSSITPGSRRNAAGLEERDMAAPAVTNLLPAVSTSFEEGPPQVNGKDVNVKLKLSSKSDKERVVVININVNAMEYHGRPAGKIRNERKEVKLQPKKVYSIPITVPYCEYHKHMVESHSIRIKAVVSDKNSSESVFVAEEDIVLEQPKISVEILGECKLNTRVDAHVVFENPMSDPLKECNLTISGTGLWRGEPYDVPIQDIQPGRRLKLKFPIFPYKTGERTLVVSFNSTEIRDNKGCCTVNVKP